jgi:hypothetical protein
LQKTPSSTTGPDNAPEGTVYMFIETSNPKVQGDYAMLASPTLTGNYTSLYITSNTIPSCIFKLLLIQLEI